MKKSQMARIVAFDKMIRNREYPSICSFSVDNWISERTIGRDIEFLRDRLEAPLEYDLNRKGYYYSKPWDLPTVVALSVKENLTTHIIEQFKRLNTAERKIVIQSLQEYYFSAKSSKLLMSPMVACPTFIVPRA